MYDPQNKTYLAPINYLVNNFIYEYDIAKANLNILYYKGVINKSQYDEIITYDRATREIYFGNLSKNKDISDALSEGLVEFRKRFIEENNLDVTNILSVKNDAFFIINTKPEHTKFDNIDFKLKNVFSSYYHINKLEMYYYLDIINDRELLDIKGINDNKLISHQEYFITFLCSVFEAIQTNTIEGCIDLINAFYMKYVNKELPYGYYRELNSDSLYRLSLPNHMQFLTVGIDDNNFEYLNIVNNLNIIRELSSIVNIIYNNSK